MRNILAYISLTIILVVMLSSCGRQPHGVMSVNEMADLIVDLKLAEAYIEAHISDFETDSSKLVIKQSIFKKHGITQQDYDSSIVWYAHNMEDYNKAYDKAIGKLKHRYEKVCKGTSNGFDEEQELNAGGVPQGAPTHDATPKRPKPHGGRIMAFNGDTTDLWRGQRSYVLTQGSRRGFITFDVQPGNDSQRGDRYQLAYLLNRGNNEFKVSLSIDYTDGATSQITRGTNSDGWVNIDVQSDTARQVRRIYGYVSYDIKPGHIASVDSLSLIRSRLNKSNYGFINAQRMFKRKTK